MKRTISTIVGLVFIVSATMVLFANDACAKAPKYYRHRYHHRHKASATPVWTAPKPAGMSTWCKRHSGDCPARGAQDPKVNSSIEHCMDKNGNGDGYISPFEKNKFSGVCKN